MNESKAWDKMFYFQDFRCFTSVDLNWALKTFKTFHWMLGVLEIRQFLWGTFNIETLCLLIIHRVLWSRNCMKSGKGWHLYQKDFIKTMRGKVKWSHGNGKCNLHKQMKRNKRKIKCNKWEIMWCCNSLRLIYW